MDIITATPFALPPGTYVFVADITTGPIVLQISLDKGVTFQNMTDGSIAASQDEVIFIAADFQYQATIPGGDFLSISLVDNGAN